MEGEDVPGPASRGEDTGQRQALCSFSHRPANRQGLPRCCPGLRVEPCEGSVTGDCRGHADGLGEARGQARGLRGCLAGAGQRRACGGAGCSVSRGPGHSAMPGGVQSHVTYMGWAGGPRLPRSLSPSGRQRPWGLADGVDVRRGQGAMPPAWACLREEPPEVEARPEPVETTHTGARPPVALRVPWRGLQAFEEAPQPQGRLLAWGRQGPMGARQGRAGGPRPHGPAPSSLSSGSRGPGDWWTDRRDQEAGREGVAERRGRRERRWG